MSEALLGKTASRIIDATQRASWRIFVSTYLLDEVERVIADKLGFSRRLATLSRQRVLMRAIPIEPGASRHRVESDPNDSPILRCAIESGVDFLVTNDRHLLELNPYEGIRIISSSQYERVVRDEGILQ